MKRAIEEYFPIIEINRLAVPERNAFKPIYQMHKWFDRRSSSVFRAILLGALKPAGTDIMLRVFELIPPAPFSWEEKGENGFEALKVPFSF